jgi:hypothetical protein
MGQAQKVEGAVFVLRFLASTRFPARAQRRLCRRKAQTTARKPLWQHGHDPAGICCQLAAHDTVISKAHQEASALHPWPYLALEPCIPPMMAASMGPPRGDDATLRDAWLRVRQHAFFHDPGVQPLPNEAQDPPIIDPCAQRVA